MIIIKNLSETESVNIIEHIEKITILEPGTSMELDSNTKKWSDGIVIVELT